MIRRCVRAHLISHIDVHMLMLLKFIVEVNITLLLWVSFCLEHCGAEGSFTLAQPLCDSFRIGYYRITISTGGMNVTKLNGATVCSVIFRTLGGRSVCFAHARSVGVVGARVMEPLTLRAAATS